jgi:dihydroneopterin aldolase
VEPESRLNGNAPGSSTSDRLHLGVFGIRLVGHHGIYPEEREHGNRFIVDVEWECKSLDAADSDNLGDTVDYQGVTQLVREISDRRTFRLIESFAGAIADGILEQYALVETVVARVSKLAPPGLGDVARATAELRRSRR